MPQPAEFFNRLLGQGQETARKVQCRNNLAQMGRALHNYAGQFDSFPPSSTGWIVGPGAFQVSGRNPTAPSGAGQTIETDAASPGHGHVYSWLALILPQIEQPQVRALLDFKALTFDPASTNPALLPRYQRAASTEINVFRCPSFRGNPFSTATEFSAGGIFTNVALTQYVGMGASTINRLLDPGVPCDGVLFPPKYRIRGGCSFRDITDGTSNTVLVVETRETKYAVWLDGSTATVWALHADPAQVGTHPGSQVKPAGTGGAPFATISANPGTSTSVLPALGLGGNSLDTRPQSASGNRVVFATPQLLRNLSRTSASGATSPRLVVFNGNWDWGPSSAHSGDGAFHLMADSSVQWVQSTVQAQAYLAISTRTGKEPVDGALTP
ncbi:MAG: DUF1559 domain-containing protein [Pirellulales bacterium]